jgi:hypothetical protein
MIYSLDVFDTILGRAHSLMRDRARLAFRPLGNQLVSPEELAGLRQKAERMALDVYGADLYSLDQIYDQIQKISDLDPLLLSKAKQQELKMEWD